MNNMMGNPVMQLIGMARQGKDPRQMVRQLAMRDPRAAQVEKILGGKSAAQQREIVQNMASERGIDLNDLARSLGISIPSER